jgi:opacity protein-like surface antigen
LSASDIGFGDRKLLLDFPALDASDIAAYHVYLSTEQFGSEDYEVGGPVFEASNKVTNPVVVAPPLEGGRVTTEITKLTNEVTYYIGVRAVDASDQEGPMSNVVTGRPRETNTAAKLLDEQGGPACAVGAGAGLGWLGMIMGGAMLARRRRHTVGMMAAVLVCGAVASDVAHADDDNVPAVMRADSTAAWSSFEVGYDVMTIQQEGLRDVYGPTWGAVRLEGGPQFYRVFEIDLGVGILTKKGNTLDASGAASTEVARMTLLPLSLGATARVHILDEQPVVPFASIGVDWVFFRENAVDADNAPVLSSRVTGSKSGWHWAAGTNILLDLFGPTRASRLEAATGINDTWLMLAYKRQQIGPNVGGFDFSGWSIYVGLKLDY